MEVEIYEHTFLYNDSTNDFSTFKVTKHIATFTGKCYRVSHEGTRYRSSINKDRLDKVSKWADRNGAVLYRMWSFKPYNFAVFADGIVSRTKYDVEVAERNVAQKKATLTIVEMLTDMLKKEVN